MPSSVSYLHLEPEVELPEIQASSPSRIIVIAETEVSPEWQSVVSDWMVQSGCVYMMAWGVGCSSWGDSVDMANIESFKFGHIPEDRFVMTTWHLEESLEEVFWYSKNLAIHHAAEIQRTVLLHIAAVSKERELLASFSVA